MKKTIILVAAIIMSVMTLMGCSSSAKTAKSKNSEYNVNVCVIDTDGNPIAGVKVQACDDAVCKVSDTDSEGFAGFNMNQNVADIHILKAPEVFTVNPKEVYTTDKSGAITITLDK